METGEIFSSASAAERVMRERGKSVGASKVLMCCKGKRNTSGVSLGMVIIKIDLENNRD